MKHHAWSGSSVWRSSSCCATHPRTPGRVWKIWVKITILVLGTYNQNEGCDEKIFIVFGDFRSRHFLFLLYS